MERRAGVPVLEKPLSALWRKSSYTAHCPPPPRHPEAEELKARRPCTMYKRVSRITSTVLAAP